MSVTEWVIDTYTKKSDEEINLEPSKNFTFIWSLFEAFSKQSIFSQENLVNQEFIDWINSLTITTTTMGIRISNMPLQNTIDENLVEKIQSSFNHFYQLYLNDTIAFVNKLYNQNIKQVEREKNKFNDFMSTFDKNLVKHKMIFLYFIAKRMRNKFFHGIKSISDVSNDHKEFEKISEFLIPIISLIEDYKN